MVVGDFDVASNLQVGGSHFGHRSPEKPMTSRLVLLLPLDGGLREGGLVNYLGGGLC